MAIRQIYRLNPQDLGQPKGIGISVLYSNNTSVFNSTITTKDQIKSNLIQSNPSALVFPQFYSLKSFSISTI